MTERDPGEGFFDHLDDPSGNAPHADSLPAVMRRGRQLRARRRATWTASAAAGVTVAVIGGLGVSHALNSAGGPNDSVQPIDNGPSATATATPGKHHRGDGKGGDGGTQVIGPDGPLAPGTHKTTSPSPTTVPSPADSCAAAAAGETPVARPAVTGATLPPLAPSPTASSSCEPTTPSPTTSPSESATAEPTDSPQPSQTPSQRQADRAIAS